MLTKGGSGICITMPVPIAEVAAMPGDLAGNVLGETWALVLVMH